MKFLLASALMLLHGFSYPNLGKTEKNIIQNGEIMADVRNQTTFILLRHAEKDGVGNNPGLSAEGLARAEMLRHTLQNITIDAIYSTPYNRTRQTVQPLATERKITITDYDANTFPSRLIEQILASNSGKTVVIVGHSNTIPAIIKTLSKTTAVTISESQYDNLYIAAHTAETEATVLQLKYGKPTE